MKDRMSSRERLLAAINHQEVDRVPICFRDVAPLEHRWSTPFERVLALRELGVDDKLFLYPPLDSDPTARSTMTGMLYATYGAALWPMHPDVTVRDWIDGTLDSRYPVAVKEISTPKGVLRSSARVTDDWDLTALPLVSDHIWSRGLEFPVKGAEDLEKLHFVLYDPFVSIPDSYREQVKAVKDFAAKHDVLVEGDANSFSNMALSLRGPQQLMCDIAEGNLLAYELLDMVAEWNLKRIELLLDFGVDTVYHTACYETTAFWSPAMYRQCFRPYLENILALLHQGGVKLHYYMDLGIMPLLEDFKEMGVDILSTLDPLPYGNTDIAEVKSYLGDTTCLWGGVNAPQVIEQGGASDVRQAVREAIRTAAPGGGFVLSTADSVWDTDVLDNVMAFIEAGLEFGRYPLSV